MRGLRLAAWALVAALPASASGAEDLGRKVFLGIAQPSCAICHTLKAAGATGTVGPSLDELKPDKGRALDAVRNGVGVMPAFVDKLTPAQIEAVADFVARSVGSQ